MQSALRIRHVNCQQDLQLRKTVISFETRNISKDENVEGAYNSCALRSENLPVCLSGVAIN